MSEATLQADLQRELLRLTADFQTGDVPIADWSLLDGSSQAAPFAIIEVADDFSLAGMQTEWANVWQIPFTLIVAFTDWDTSMAAIAALRARVLAHLLDTVHYDGESTTLSWGLRSIKSGTGISSIYDRYPENPAESLPAYLSQRIILEVEETSGG